MKKIVILALFLFNICATAQHSNIEFEEATTFYPYAADELQVGIDWGYFTVPEDWENPDGNKIKLGLAIMRNRTNSKDTNPIVTIAGGPGGSALQGILYWQQHPIRQKSDIILIDARGTGFSTPRLCPDLGNDLLKILAKNQSPKQDEEQKVLAAMACKEHLVGKGINVSAYNSKSIANDLHAIKEYFKYPSWNVYGVSYGTYVAQVYAQEFPNDVKSLILDSPISDISTYYTNNTSNYVTSLNKVFKNCKDDPKCNAEYPNLEDIYYGVVEDLTKSPITVNVEKSVIEDETFTYNAEDFKVAIHQALYQKQLIEVLPLLIYQFHNRNEDALSSLVAAFAGALGLDYGMYYCVSCYETIPRNSIEEYNEDSNKHPRLKGGLSFYSSDFAVCDKWNNQENKFETKEYLASDIETPTLIFVGDYDPITPSVNGDSLAFHIENSTLLTAVSNGHASSFTPKGFEITNKFINAPNTKITNEEFDANSKINYVKDIHVNGGISKLGNSVNSLDILFLTPLIIAVLISILAIFLYIVSLIRRRKEKDLPNMIIKLLLIVSSIVGLGVLAGFVMALQETAAMNSYILAIGIPEQWSYLFTWLLVFLGLTLLAFLFFIITIKKLEDRSVIFTVIFSNILIVVYFMYWGVFTFI